MRNDSFQNHSNMIRRMFIAFACSFVLILCLIIGIWGFVGYGIYSVVSDPASVGHATGEFVGGINKAVQESQQRQ